jgi:PD-(D/E)XK endonuclease
MGHGPADTVARLDNVLSTNQKGAIAESAITAEAVRLGVGVFRAVADERYDLVLDIGARLLRVQCKTAAFNGDVLVIRCYSCRRTAGGMLKRSYTSDEIDAVAAYCDELGRCFLIPINRVDGLSTIQLRLVRAKNNQARRINWANDFEFAATLGSLGAVAQLGERRAGSA